MRIDIKVVCRGACIRWKVADLAKKAGVSLGHVSNVRHALIDREWARSDPEGLILTEPDALLDTLLQGAAMKGGVKGELASFRPLINRAPAPTDPSAFGSMIASGHSCRFKGASVASALAPKADVLLPHIACREWDGPAALPPPTALRVRGGLPG